MHIRREISTWLEASSSSLHPCRSHRARCVLASIIASIKVTMLKGTLQRIVALNQLLESLHHLHLISPQSFRVHHFQASIQTNEEVPGFFRAIFQLRMRRGLRWCNCWLFLGSLPPPEATPVQRRRWGFERRTGAHFRTSPLLFLCVCESLGLGPYCFTIHTPPRSMHLQAWLMWSNGLVTWAYALFYFGKHLFSAHAPLAQFLYFYFIFILIILFDYYYYFALLIL